MYTTEKNTVETSSLSVRSHPKPSGTPPDTPTLSRSSNIEMVENCSSDRATIVCKAAETASVGCATQTCNSLPLSSSSFAATIKDSSESNNTNFHHKKQTLSKGENKAVEPESRENFQKSELVLKNGYRNNGNTDDGDATMEDDDNDTALAAASLLTFARGDGTSSADDEDKECDSRLNMTESLIQSPSSLESSPEAEEVASESSAKASASIPDVFSSKHSTPDSPSVEDSRPQSPNKSSNTSLNASSSCTSMTPEDAQTILSSITVASAKISRGRPRGKGVGTSRKPKFKYQKSACMACHKAHMACKERDNPDGCFECRTLRKGRECVPRADGRKNRRRNKTRVLNGEGVAKQTGKVVKRQRRSTISVPSKKSSSAVDSKDINLDTSINTPKSPTEPMTANTTPSTPEPPSQKRRRLNTDIEDLIAENTLAPCTPESRENPTTITLPSIKEVFGERKSIDVNKQTLQAQIDELRNMTNMLASMLKEKEGREKEQNI